MHAFNKADYVVKKCKNNYIISLGKTLFVAVESKHTPVRINKIHCNTNYVLFMDI